MKKFLKRRGSALLVSTIFSLSASLNANAVDTSVATLNISGEVPVVFSVTARGYPGDLDLNPGTKVNDRVMGILHFKYNSAIASLKISSNTASGYPENSTNTAYAFPVGHEMYFEATGCSVVSAVVLNGSTKLTQAGVEVLDAAAPALGEFDCSLTASWWGAATIQPAGVYSMTVTVTMTSG